MLAGISVDYYLRLEQGRDHHPSPQVLRGLARALQLDDDGIEYLLALGADRPRARARRAMRERVPPGTAELLVELPHPAFIEDRVFDVRAVNHLATAFSPRLRVGANRLRDVFLDPAERRFQVDWDAAARGIVAGFRRSVSTDLDGARVVDLVGELSLASPQFRRLWARQDVRRPERGEVEVEHPELGRIVVRREKFAILGSNELVLVIYHAAIGSRDADAMALLASSATTHESA